MPYLIAQEGPLKGLVLDLEDGDEWIVGRDPDEADLLTEDATVSRKHLRVTRKGDEFFLENLSYTSPTLINDEPIQPNVPLHANDKVKIGENIFLFSNEAAPASSEAQPKKASSGYDGIFGDLEEPELPPEPEPLETSASEPPEEEKESAAKTAYDTIFEDVESASEMPFNLLSETPLVLKVIGGPNAGAEIGLEKGRSYLLGKDSAVCDIVFQDLSVSRSHARLNISADGIIDLEDLGSKNSTIVNGSPITEKQVITSQDLIAMGTTVFLIIDREAVQETIFSPALPAYEAASTEKGAALPEEELALHEKVPEGKEFDWKQEKIPSKYLVFAGSFAAIFLIVFISFFSLFKSEKIETVAKLPHDAIKEALQPYPGVHYAYNPTSGNLFLAGHVLTAVNYQELLFNLGQLQGISSLDNNIVVDEGVAKSMNDMLNSHPIWQGIFISVSQPAHFIVQGYVKTAKDAADAAEYLTLNFPYVDLLQNRIIAEDLLSIQVQTMLMASGFGAVAPQINNGNIVLAGSYSGNQEHQFNQLVEKINKLQGVKSVQSFAVSIGGQTSSSIDLTREYAVTGTALHDTKGYSAVINGRVYTIGESINGMHITSIQTDTIFLEKDGLKYKISFTR